MEILVDQDVLALLGVQFVIVNSVSWDFKVGSSISVALIILGVKEPFVLLIPGGRTELDMSEYIIL